MAPTFAPDYTLAGRYRILELVGVGRTAEVYAAEDLSLQRRVAVKVLLPDLAAHEDIRRAFRDRIIRASKLSHPHLARVFDGGQEHGSIFMISEYLSGGSLEDVLRADDASAWTKALASDATSPTRSPTCTNTASFSARSLPPNCSLTTKDACE